MIVVPMQIIALTTQMYENLLKEAKFVKPRHLHKKTKYQRILDTLR